MELESKLWNLVELLSPQNSMPKESDESGYESILANYPAEMVNTVLLAAERFPKGAGFMDFMCGNAAPGLLFAAAGFASYNCDVNPKLIELANENHKQAFAAGLIDSKTPFQAVVGNPFAKPPWPRYLDKMRKQVAEQFKATYGYEMQSHRFLTMQGEAPKLAVNYKDADIVYCWPPFYSLPAIYAFIAKEMKPSIRLILPHLDLEPPYVLSLHQSDIAAAGVQGIILAKEVGSTSTFTIFRRG